MKTIRTLIATVLFVTTSLGIARAQTNTAAVVTAVNAFLATLSTSQSNSVIYTSNLTNSEAWSNLPISAATRNGLRFDSLSTAQLTAALNIGTNALGNTGAWLFDQIRKADALLGSSASGYSSNYYYIAFVGVPSTNSAWLLQMGGHHIAYNISFNTTNISATPFFVGVEPKVWTNSGVIYSPLTNKFSAAYNLRQILGTNALLSGTYSDIVFGANGTGNHDNYPQSYPTTGRGVCCTNLTAAQITLVKAVIEAWVTNASPAVASQLLPIYESDLAMSQTYVGYSGSDAALGTAASYVRVDGPRAWIEFICQNGIVYSGIHFHTIWRDKLSDYGSSFGVCTTNVVPTISTQPTNRTVTAGSSTTFTVAVAGTAPFVYQWYKDSVAISGATNASYSISSTASTNAGTYYVYVLNTVGTVTSTNATLTVSTANTAPVLSAVSNRTIDPGYALLITNTATDSDTPSQTLTFSLTTAPTNASINASSGVLSWRPIIAQANSTNAFAVTVTDNGSPAMSATQAFSVFVNAVTTPTNASVKWDGGVFEITVSGAVGPDYIIQGSTNLAGGNWFSIATNTPTAMPFVYTNAAVSNYSAQYFRVLLGP